MTTTEVPPAAGPDVGLIPVTVGVEGGGELPPDALMSTARLAEGSAMVWVATGATVEVTEGSKATMLPSAVMSKVN
ncbi:MAG TPA: hypothetical protein VKV36_01495, partial [Acidimicrobiales bacterium]|nr:hypothetical protein [Acidimicrobiales bacterium]